MLKSKYKAIVFDLDGTLYIGDTVVEGAVELVNSFKEKGLRPFYFTNNSTKTRDQILSKLRNMGFDLKIEDVYTSAYATAAYAKSKNINSVYCVGSNGLKEEFKTMDIQVEHGNAEVDAVIVGLDLEFNYETMATVLNMINKGCEVIVCNRDKNFPVENNRLMPGCGAMVAAIEGCSNKEIDYSVGKPGTYMIEQLADDWGYSKGELLVVGDCYEYDIEMAKSYGCDSALIVNDLDTVYENTNIIKKVNELENIVFN